MRRLISTVYFDNFDLEAFIKRFPIRVSHILGDVLGCSTGLFSVGSSKSGGYLENSDFRIGQCCSLSWL